jgi:hypothetical protein
MNFKALVLTSVAVQVTLTQHAATLIVTNTGNSGPGTLRDQVALSSPGDTIRFAVTGTITLIGEIPIAWLLHIEGPGPLKLTVDANKTDRAFIAFNGPVYISGMTIRNGLVVGAAGADGLPGMNGGTGGNAYGGAILTSCDLALSNIWFTENTVIGGQGGRGGDITPFAGIQPGDGGLGGQASCAAVLITSQMFALVANKCTFSSNTATGGNGGAGGNNYNTAGVIPGGNGGIGGLGEEGAANPLILKNCTFSGNKAIGGNGGQGGDSDASTSGGTGGNGGNALDGAIFLATGGVMISCTVVSNSAIKGLGGGGGAGSPNGPAGMDGMGFVGGADGQMGMPVCDRHVGNTIVANNFATTANSNIYMTVDDLGFNYFGDNDYPGKCIGLLTRVGTVQAPLNPQLGPLAQNGGGLPTHAPLNGSPVIGYGSNFATISDERGAPRPFGPPAILASDGSDVGAVEFGSPPLGGGIGGGGSNFVVSWPAYYGDFTLLSAPSLENPSNWSIVPDTPMVIDDQFVVSNSIVSPAMFYRLIHN